jgi:uncharacterized membrane protein
MQGKTMKKLSPKSQRWLKAFHILCVSLWVGGAITISSKQFYIQAKTDGELYGILSAMDYVDFFIIIPGALGCFVTGLIYSTLTPWGWVKYRWIIVKWILCLYGIIFGTFFLGPWLATLVQLSQTYGLKALTNPLFCYYLTMLMVFGTFQAATLVFACFISSLKPWGKR